MPLDKTDLLYTFHIDQKTLNRYKTNKDSNFSGFVGNTHVFIIYSQKKNKYVLRLGSSCRKRGEFKSIVDVIAYCQDRGIPLIGKCRNFHVTVINGKYSNWRI